MRRRAAASWSRFRLRARPDSRARELAPLTAMDLFASALDQAAAVRRREVSSTELTRAYLERIERFNPKLNAFVLRTPELALEQAKAADEANIGYPLRGVPTSVKDLVSLAGYPLTFGSKAFEDYTLPIDFFPVARLKEEGCPILGKTNLSDFGTRPTERSRAPSPTRLPASTRWRDICLAMRTGPTWTAGLPTPPPPPTASCGSASRSAPGPKSKTTSRNACEMWRDCWRVSATV